MMLQAGLQFIAVCVLFLHSTAFVCSAQSKAKQSPPNIVVIITDQWRGQALGFVGKEKVKTPHLDALARGGLALTQMVANYPVCSPARAMIMTGIYPMRNNVPCNANSASAVHGIELPQNMICWSDILKAKGYSNGYIGKWHLEAPHQPYIQTSNNTEELAWNEWTAPQRRHGFDYWYAYNTYDEHDRPMYWDTKASRDNFHYVNQWGPEHEADKAIDFLNNKGNVRKEGAPFSLVISINPPHSPYDRVPEKYVAAYKDVALDSLVKNTNIPPAGTAMGDFYRENIKNYYANITGVDDQIGRIIQTLKNKKLLDNSIVLVTADHGNCLGIHNEVSKNNIYEESLRIPFIIYWKGKIKPRIDDQFLGSLPDIYPTLMELAGFKKDLPKNLEGSSYAAYIRSGKGAVPSEQFIIGSIKEEKVLRTTGFRGIRTKQYKLAYQKVQDETVCYFFDLQKDPFELNNLYDKNHPEVKRLHARLKYWLQKTGDVFKLDF